MKVELAPIDTIKPYPNNPRKLSETAIEKVAQSIQEFGFRQPIVIDKDRIIVVGHTRYRASKKLGYKKVPITIAENLTKEQINAYRIADNRTNEEAKWDEELLKMELKELDYKDFDLKMTGFDDKQINDLLFEEKQGLTDDDAVPDTPEEPITKLGDIWHLGKHRLLCGDSTKIDNINKLFKNETVDLLLTDPPYGIDYSKKNEFLNKFDEGNRIETDIRNDSIENIEQFCTDFLKPIPFSQYNIFYIFITSQQLHNVRLSLEDNKFHTSTYLIWNKNNHVLGRMDYLMKHELIMYGWKNRHKFYGKKTASVINFDRPVKNDLHPTMKPVGLLQLLIKDGSLPNQNVYDPFLGSGSTLIACEKLDRKCYGMELEPKYCDVIVKRWEQWTGEKATK